MPRTVTEDVDGEEEEKERKEKREALREVGFDRSLGGGRKKNSGDEKEKGRKWKRKLAARILF